MILFVYFSIHSLYSYKLLRAKSNMMIFFLFHHSQFILLRARSNMMIFFFTVHSLYSCRPEVVHFFVCLCAI